MSRVSYILSAFLTFVVSTASRETYEEYLERGMRPLSEPLDLPGITCELDSTTTCPDGQCCVKEVISYQDLDRDMEVRTTCQPMRVLGELCLRKTEGYLCDCARGLQCAFQNNETYGHCGPLEFEDEAEMKPKT